MWSMCVTTVSERGVFGALCSAVEAKRVYARHRVCRCRCWGCVVRPVPCMTAAIAVVDVHLVRCNGRIIIHSPAKYNHRVLSVETLLIYGEHNTFIHYLFACNLQLEIKGPEWIKIYGCIEGFLCVRISRCTPSDKCGRGCCLSNFCPTHNFQPIFHLGDIQFCFNFGNAL